MSKRAQAQEEWTWGVARSHEELEEQDWEFWQAQPADKRLEAAFQATIDAWLLHDGDSDSGIDLRVFGVRKFGAKLP